MKVENMLGEDFFDKLEDTIENDIEAGKMDIGLFLGENDWFEIWVLSERAKQRNN